MLVELVSFLNDDGLHLDGAFYPPTREIDRAGTVDAVLLIHGSRGNFYDGVTKSMAEDLQWISDIKPDTQLTQRTQTHS